MFVRTLVTAAGPRDVPCPSRSTHVGQPSPDTRHTAWPPVTLRERAVSASGACKKRTKPPGTSGSLAFPCERADHLEVSCSERYRQSCPPSNDCRKPDFHQMWTTCGNDVHRSPSVCGPQSLCVETYAWAVWKPVAALVWPTLFGYLCTQSQGLIQILPRGRLSRAIQLWSSKPLVL